VNLGRSDFRSGYYKWQKNTGGKQPWYFTARAGSPALTIAGLWDEWHDKGGGDILKSCTMIREQVCHRGRRSNAGPARREKLRTKAVRRRRDGIAPAAEDLLQR